MTRQKEQPNSCSKNKATEDFVTKLAKALQRISVQNRLRQRLQEIPQGIYDGILITRYIKKPSQLCEGYRLLLLYLVLYKYNNH